MNAKELVAQWEKTGVATVNLDELQALIASWRERGKAIEQMRAYQAQLEERIAALKDKP